MNYELAINIKTASMVGLTIPPGMLANVEEVRRIAVQFAAPAQVWNWHFSDIKGYGSKVRLRA